MSDERAAFARLHPVIQHHVVNTLAWPGLRPLQTAAIDPVLAGSDALLIAPTAGGKTEAAIFPLLTRIAQESWSGLSVLYVCPLKALLNNLQPRLEVCAGWLGVRVSVRHGDTGAGQRRAQAAYPPSILLTTPESLEALLVSTLVDPDRLFAQLRAVVVDEVHAFAGDDRGWHLLAVLDRLGALAGRPLQRIGLSATVGNPDPLLMWLQGRDDSRPRVVVAPQAEVASVPELVLDHVGNVSNAAKVVSGIYLGEKRLVFADSRRVVEQLALDLRERGVQTFVSHSSLSAGERRRAEEAFAGARDCVIVSTSTLELGIDVGDLDRVLQVGAPTSVASVLQRLGRTGRRPGSTRNLTFLATSEEELLRAAGLLLLLERGYVEPVTPPPAPRHISAQQLLGLALQKGRIDLDGEGAGLAGLGLCAREEVGPIGDWLVETGHLDTDQGLAFVGPAAERTFGRRNFMELLAVFTAVPEVVVLHGRTEIGSLDPMALTSKEQGPRVVTLAGRAWTVTHIDWRRRRAYVEPSEQPGRSAWTGGARVWSFALTDAMRAVLLGHGPGERSADGAGAVLTARATQRLARLREQHAHLVDEDASVVATDRGRTRWWTFAGLHANAVLTAALGAAAPELLDTGGYTNVTIALRPGTTGAEVIAALHTAASLPVSINRPIGRKPDTAFGGAYAARLGAHLPPVSPQALRQLKFTELLPPALAAATLALRSADHAGAQSIIARRIITTA